MRFLTHLKEVLVQSVTNVRWYRHIEQRVSKWLSLGLFCVVVFVAALVPAQRFVSGVVPQLEDALQQGSDQLVAQFPEDARVAWTGERLEVAGAAAVTDDSGRVVLPFPEGVTVPEEFEQYEVLAVYASESAVGSIGELEEDVVQRGPLPFVAVTPEQLSVRGQAEWQRMQLQEAFAGVEPFLIDDENIAEHVAAARELAVGALQSLAPLAYVVIPVFFLVARLVEITIYAALIWGIWLITGNRRRFSQLWQISLHIGLIASVIGAATQLALPQLELSMYSLSFWVLLTYVLLFNGEARVVEKKAE
jgi:hypothetical protein